MALTDKGLGELDAIIKQAKAEAWDEAIEEAFLYNLSPEGWERRQEIKNPYKEQD